MPEGPECLYIRDCLEKLLKEKSLSKVNIISGRYNRHGPPKGWIDLEAQLKEGPLKIIKIGCKGKFLYWIFENQSSLWITLGMSGQWTNYYMGHCHIEFTLTDNEKIYFRDVRNFGTLKYMKQIDLLHKKLETLGYDILNPIPLSNTKCLQVFKKRLNMNICRFLMLQTHFSGVGNYIKSEALHIAKIHPFSNIKKIPDQQLLDLYQALQMIAKISYLAKDNSIRNPDQNKGKYSFSFKVYSQTKFGDYRVENGKTPDNRTSFWISELVTLYD